MSGLALRTQQGVFVSMVTMAIAFFALLFLSSQLIGGINNPFLGVGIVAVLGGALFVGAFYVSGLIAPNPTPPQNLTVGGVQLEFKEIWKSKTFWLAILMLAVQIFNLAAGSDVLGQDFVDQIAALDWSNWLQAGIALIMIIVRKFFTGSPVK